MSFDPLSQSSWLLDAEMLSETCEDIITDPNDLAENIRMFTDTTSFYYNENSGHKHDNLNIDDDLKAKSRINSYSIHKNDALTKSMMLLKQQGAESMNSNYLMSAPYAKMIHNVDSQDAERNNKKRTGSGSSNKSNCQKFGRHEEDISNSYITPEEDRRRRNTAASARFRHKKKMREQELEQSVKTLNEQITALQAKLKEQELENKLLKSLISKNIS